MNPSGTDNTGFVPEAPPQTSSPTPAGHAPFTAPPLDSRAYAQAKLFGIDENGTTRRPRVLSLLMYLCNTSEIARLEALDPSERSRIQSERQAELDEAGVSSDLQLDARDSFQIYGSDRVSELVKEVICGSRLLLSCPMEYRHGIRVYTTSLAILLAAKQVHHADNFNLVIALARTVKMCNPEEMIREHNKHFIAIEGMSILEISEQLSLQ